MLGRRTKRAESSPREDPSSIGNLAIELGYITRDELDAAVKVQQQRLPLGQILVDMGKLTTVQLEDLLLEQRVRRGEIQDRDVLMAHERSRLRRKMGEIKAGFREMGAETKRFSTSLFDVTHAMRARVK